MVGTEEGTRITEGTTAAIIGSTQTRTLPAEMPMVCITPLAGRSRCIDGDPRRTERVQGSRDQLTVEFSTTLGVCTHAIKPPRGQVLGVSPELNLPAITEHEVDAWVTHQMQKKDVDAGSNVLGCWCGTEQLMM